MSPFGFLLSPSDNDGDYFAQAMQQAQHAVGRTHPNPPVGCVIVKDDVVVGRGFTSPAGGPHAEVHALAQAGDDAHGATLYVTLEPCSHFGRTPPCVDAIIAAGVKQVVVGAQDPNPRVNGGGLSRLREHGIDIVMRERDPVLLPFMKCVTAKKPWVIAKVATSLDGCVCERVGHSTQISGAVAHTLLHQLRNHVDAVMVGSNTVLIDDPKLTVRGLVGQDARNPIRVVVDGSLRTDVTHQVYRDDARRIVIHSESDARAQPFRDVGVETIGVAKLDGHASLSDAFTRLGEFVLTSILVECGSAMLTQMLNDDLLDELWWLTSPKIFGSSGTHSVGKLRESIQSRYTWQTPVVLGEDTLTRSLRNLTPPAPSPTGRGVRGEVGF